jgi:hypothetical protein
MVSRRSFLAGLAAAFALDPERALFVPGKKLISVPAPRVRTLRMLGYEAPAPEDFLSLRFDQWRDIIDPLLETIEVEINHMCGDLMVRPRYVHLALPDYDAVPFAERCTFFKSGFMGRTMLGADVMSGKLILRVESLFEA